MDIIFRFGAALTAAAFISFISGFTLLTSIPCGWFGSSFEGACGYGVAYAAAGVGTLIFCAFFALLLWFRFDLWLTTVAQRRPGMQLMLYFLCALLVVLIYAASLTTLLSGGSTESAIAPLFLLPAFMIVSAMIAPLRKRHPSVSFLAFIPIIGPITVAVLLLKATAAAPNQIAKT